MSTERSLPYDLAFESEFEQRHFPAMRSEAEQRQTAVDNAETFLQLQSVGSVLREVLVQSSETAVEQFGPLLFQAYHFWLADKPVYELDEPLFRYLVDNLAPIGRWQLTVPARAGYLCLPRNRLWARIAAEARPEAVDGIFWFAASDTHGAVVRLDALLVLGLIPGRPGFSVIEVTGHPADEPDGHWGDAHAREGHNDFANVLPGGELQQLHALETAGEVLKLLARVFWYHSMQLRALEPETRDGRRILHLVDG